MGVALYRSGEWKEARAALEKSLALDSTNELSNAVNRLFLAMGHWQLNRKGEARKTREQALQGMAKLQAAPEELECFRNEVVDVLGKP